MALNMDAILKISANVQGANSVQSFSRDLKGLNSAAKLSGAELGRMNIAINRMAREAGNTTAGLRQHLSALQTLRDRVEIGGKAYNRLGGEIDRLKGKLRGLEGEASRSNKWLAGLAASASTIATGALVAGVSAAGVMVARVGVDAESAQVRLKALTDQFGEYNQAQAATARIAQTLRISQIEASDSFSQLYAALRPTGVTMKELEQIFIGFTAAARNSGTGAEETRNAFIQLRQALAQGRLQGEELQSISQQAPVVAQAISKVMGITVGELKKYASEGKVTSDIIIKALQRLNTTELGKLNAQFNTSAQALADLKIAADDAARELAKVFGPATVSLLRLFTKQVEAAPRAIEDTALAFGYAADKLSPLLNGLKQLQWYFTNLTPPGWAMQVIQGSAGLGRQVIADLANRARGAAKQDPPQQPTAAQRAAVDAAARERAAAQARAAAAAKQAADEAKKATTERVKNERNAADEQLKIRLDAEKRVAEYRAQALERATQMERDLADQRLELERGTAEARRRIQAQEEDAALQMEKLRLRAQGLPTEGIDEQLKLNEATRQFEEERIKAAQSASDRRVQLERRLEEYKIEVAKGIREILVDAGERMAEAMRGGAAGAVAGAAPAGAGGRRSLGVGALKGLAKAAGFNDRDASIMAAIAMAESGGIPSQLNDNPRTGDLSYGLWQVNMIGRMGPERRRQFGISSNEALRNPEINAMAARQVFQSQGFNAWSVFRSGAYRQYLPGAQAAAAQDPSSFLGARPAGAIPVTITGPIPGLAGIDAAGKRLDQAIGAIGQITTQVSVNDLLASRRESFGGAVGDLNAARQAPRQGLADFSRLMTLRRTGLSADVANQRIEAEKLAVIEADRLKRQEQQIQNDLKITGLTDKQRTDLQDQLRAVQDRLAAQPGILDNLTKESVLLERLNKQEQARQEIMDGIANAIGTGIAGSFELLISGTEDWAKSLREIASGVLKDIARQLVRVMVVSPIVDAIKDWRFATGGVMTDQGPLPLKRYATGGIANSPQLALFGEGRQPEAYVPLPDGRRIPVALKGGGGSSPVINVSVDANGTSVQGNAGQGEQLARAIARAVQDELIRQKRPGGLIPA